MKRLFYFNFLLVLLFACGIEGSKKLSPNAQYTRRILLIDLNDNIALNLDMDTMFQKFISKYDDKLCFKSSESKGEIKVVNGVNEIEKDVKFYNVLRVKLVGRLKIVDILDESVFKVIVKFRMPNKNTLMANVDLMTLGGNKKLSKSFLGNYEVDMANTSAFIDVLIKDVMSKPIYYEHINLYK